MEAITLRDQDLKFFMSNHGRYGYADPGVEFVHGPLSNVHALLVGSTIVLLGGFMGSPALSVGGKFRGYSKCVLHGKNYGTIWNQVNVDVPWGDIAIQAFVHGSRIYVLRCDSTLDDPVGVVIPEIDVYQYGRNMPAYSYPASSPVNTQVYFSDDLGVTWHSTQNPNTVAPIGANLPDNYDIVTAGKTRVQDVHFATRSRGGAVIGDTYWMFESCVETYPYPRPAYRCYAFPLNWESLPVESRGYSLVATVVPFDNTCGGLYAVPVTSPTHQGLDLSGYSILPDKLYKAYFVDSSFSGMSTWANNYVCNYASVVPKLPVMRFWDGASPYLVVGCDHFVDVSSVNPHNNDAMNFWSRNLCWKISFSDGKPVFNALSKGLRDGIYGEAEVGYTDRIQVFPGVITADDMTILVGGAWSENYYSGENTWKVNSACIKYGGVIRASRDGENWTVLNDTHVSMGTFGVYNGEDKRIVLIGDSIIPDTRLNATVPYTDRFAFQCSSPFIRPVSWYDFPLGGEPGVAPDAPAPTPTEVKGFLRVGLDDGSVSVGVGYPFVSTLQNSSPTALPGQLPDKMLAGDANGYLSKALVREASGLGNPSKYVLWTLDSGSTTTILNVLCDKSVLPTNFLVGLPVRILGANGSYVEQVVASNTTSTITLTAALATAPAAGTQILIAPMICAALLGETRYQYPARLVNLRLNLANYQDVDQSIQVGVRTAQGPRRFGDFTEAPYRLQTVTQRQLEAGGGVVGVAPHASRSLAYDLRFIPVGGGDLEIGPISVTENIQPGEGGLS